VVFEEAYLWKRWKIVLVLLLAVLAVASVMTMPRDFRPGPGSLLAGARIDSQVLAIIRRSCQDCHSEATHYPWYSYIAPVSLLIRSDVQGGREHLNFSRWHEYSLLRKERFLSEIANQVKDRDMPLPQYLWIHRDARLSDAEVEAVFQWTQNERARLITENMHAPR
jgi:hypothetical protein